MSGDTLADSAQIGEDLVGPVPGNYSPQAKLPDGITLDQFEVHREHKVALCPAGQSSTSGYERANGGVQFKFDEDTCAACPLRAQCCMGQGGRTITLGPNHAALQTARARQQTDEFEERYRQHRGGVEGCLSALVRGHGIRVNRYIGRDKNHLRASFVGAAVNLRRAARWRAGAPPGTTQGIGVGRVSSTPQNQEKLVCGDNCSVFGLPAAK